MDEILRDLHPNLHVLNAEDDMDSYQYTGRIAAFNHVSKNLSLETPEGRITLLLITRELVVFIVEELRDTFEIDLDTQKCFVNIKTVIEDAPGDMKKKIHLGFSIYSQ